MDNVERTSASDMEDIWTPQRIAHFWDMVAQEPRLRHLYFSLHYAKPIVNVARLFGMSGGKILDYGCGPGYLSRELVNSGFHTTGIEYSPASVNAANVLMQGQSVWNGCFTNDTIPGSWRNNYFDWVFSVEAYEHLRDEWIDDYFGKIRHYLASNGRLVITVPNNENLDDNLMICPCCETKFHRWGHLRTVTKENLASVVRSHGFEVELCFEVNLARMYDLKVSMFDRLLSRLVFGGNILKTIPVGVREKMRAMEKRMSESDYKSHIIVIARKTSY